MKNWLLAVGLAASVGCAATNQQTAMAPLDSHAEQRESEASGIKLRLLRIFDDIITCEVINVSNDPVLVDRDAIVLVTPTGERRSRLPGGAQTSYQVPPMGSHVVNVRYDLSGLLTEDVAQLDFGRALMRAGQPVAGPSLYVAPKKLTQ
jgi:hypothetical protein